MLTPQHMPSNPGRGSSLAELMIAVVALSIGLLAVAQLLPARSSSPGRDQLQTAANEYARQEIERFGELPWSDSALEVGRHPAGSATEDQGHLKRFYEVELMGSPRGSLKKVTVTVVSSVQGTPTVTATTYVRRRS